MNNAFQNYGRKWPWPNYRYHTCICVWRRDNQTVRSRSSLDPGAGLNRPPQFSEFPLLVYCVHLATRNDASHGLVSVFVRFPPFVTSIKGRMFRAFRTGISGVKRNL